MILTFNLALDKSDIEDRVGCITFCTQSSIWKTATMCTISNAVIHNRSESAKTHGDAFINLKLNAPCFNIDRDKNNLSLNLLNPVLKTDNLITTSLIEMFPKIIEGSIENIKIKMKTGGGLF